MSSDVLPVYIYFQGQKRRQGLVDHTRFSNPTARNVMSGVLLTPGPITTHMSVKRLSRIFNTAVTKVKFVTASRQLEKAGLGLFVETSHGAHCFVKKPPAEIYPFLQNPENCDLATYEVYDYRYNLPLSVVVKDKFVHFVVSHGLVPEAAFKGRGTL